MKGIRIKISSTKKSFYITSNNHICFTWHSPRKKNKLKDNTRKNKKFVSTYAANNFLWVKSDIYT